MAEDLDSLVKGAPAPGKQVKAAAVAGTSGVTSLSTKQGDPLNHAPSSPSMVYLNLLVLETSLRAQYLELRARRRHHTFFFIVLAAWIGGWGYGLFLAPREDGIGVGGSVYWGVETMEKLCFMGGLVTAILVWATGIWDRGIRWPRRWFTISNRGLRGFNCKLVILRRSWLAELASTLTFFLTYGLFSHTASSSYRYVEPAVLRQVEKELGLQRGSHPSIPILTTEDEEKGGAGGGHEEDLAPGGDYVKLLLLAKPFTPAFRENWELYRAEYWEKENERRALLRKRLEERDRRVAKERWGIFWWLPWNRVPDGSPRSSSASSAHAHGRHRDPHDPDKLHPRAAALEKGHRRRGSNSSTTRRRSSTSSSRSRSLTPHTHGEGEEAAAATPGLTLEKRPRRGSKLSAKPKRPHADSRTVTPDFSSPLSRESSTIGDEPAASAGPEADASAAAATAAAAAEVEALEPSKTGRPGLRSSSQTSVTPKKGLDEA